MIHSNVSNMPAEELREARKKMSAIKERVTSFTQPNRNTTIGLANNVTSRPELNGCFPICFGDPIAADAAAVPAVAAVEGSQNGTIFILPARITTDALGAFSCVMNATQAANNGFPGLLVQKIQKPDNILSDVDNIFLRIMGYSGDDVSRAELVWAPLDLIFSMNRTSVGIALGLEESMMALELYEGYQGKIASLHQHKPLKEVARILSSSGAKDNQFTSISALKNAIGLRRFVLLFRKADVPENSEDLSVSDFTLSRSRDMININLRELDNTLTHGGFSLKSDKETQNLVTFNFGSESNQISSNTIFKQSDTALDFSSPFNVLHHSIFLLAVLRIVFIDEVVDKIADMINDVRLKLRPTSGSEFTTLIDAMLQAISKPPTADGASKQAYLLFCNRQLDVSSNNPMVADYKEERTKKANDAQVAAMAVGAADLADLRDQLAASNKRTAAAMAAGGGGGSGLAGGAAPKKPKTGNGAVNTGANNTSLKTKRTARLVQLISAYTKTNPVDGYAPANHVGVKPLCVWTATGKPCVAHNRGLCKMYTHNQVSTMTPAYLAWASARPTMRDVPKVL